MESRYQKLVRKMVIDDQLPQFVYRMRSVNRYLFDTLINGEMWFPNPMDFNDPFDCDINMTFNDSQHSSIQHYYDTYLKKKFSQKELEGIETAKISNLDFGILLNKVAKRVAHQKGIACFMSNCDNLLMWAHYADSHKGICLKFDILEDVEFFTPAKRVIYANEYPQYNYLQDKNDFVNQMFFTKSDEWKYEGEIRVLKSKKDNYKFNKICLKEMIFGCNISENDKKTLMKIMRQYYPDTKLKQAVKNEYKFQLNFEDIE
ncbi:DUF2971 domain-containing protein [Flavobacterium sp. 140616W15]|uniref:DUF2971 domain-containing protein n=1 Tax=Flavobacterium sp. 140616W15 TaxID=2478552 RepID=UPI000F0CA680|nr:DUF2971 domain-containing protein [Flavobacterium sp. 140616W15]AYN04786.1 DUF2971 domain-containing protein [Flavobacterium sp. 140616W15]